MDVPSRPAHPRYDTPISIIVPDLRAFTFVAHHAVVLSLSVLCLRGPARSFAVSERPRDDAATMPRRHRDAAATPPRRRRDAAAA